MNEREFEDSEAEEDAISRRSCGHNTFTSGTSEPCETCVNEATSLAVSEALLDWNGGRAPMFGLSLPPRPEADSLIGSYWTWVHSLYPFIHQPSFEKRYLTIWDTQSVPSRGNSSQMLGCYDAISDRLFCCLLNAVLALGTLFSPEVDDLQRESVSRSFYERSKSVLDFDMLAQGSLPLVQTLLLMGQFLQLTDMASSCWNMVGLAIRVAQRLGLHRGRQEDEEEGAQQPADQLEIEMRRRAWTGCVCLDRSDLSLAYGRPLMIHFAMGQGMLPIPSQIDDEFLTRLPNAPGSQPDHILSKIECYARSIWLYQILALVLIKVYGSSGAENKDHVGFDLAHIVGPDSWKHQTIQDASLQVILKFDGLLTAERTEYANHLLVHTDGQKSVPDNTPNLERKLMFQRQAVVLEARYLE
ncbi:hypothetical protein QQX98_001531 [Neonectria punicea]|uniref:Xylanolytic transcriptional activator regulatory domain-containing protein n=1 Tax=Neonectria punicea TaxID=979145 RepID=A0ABR1HNH3_9HYPO